MKSRTKTVLTEDMVKKLVYRHFPTERVENIRELTEGMLNAAWLIEGTGNLSGGIVLKVEPAADAPLLTYEKDTLETERRVYGHLQEKPIPVPEMLAYDDSHEDVPADYFFIRNVEGCTWNHCTELISPGNRAGLMTELGRYYALVHSVKGAWFGYVKGDCRFHFDSWGQAFTAMMGDILHDGWQHNCQLPYEEIRQGVRQNRQRLDEVTVPQLVGFDMWAGNIFLNAPECTRITGMIDFGNSFYGDPFADFISAVHLFQDVSRETDFIKGYSEISNRLAVIYRDDYIRMDLYRLYMAVICYVEAYRYEEAVQNSIKNC